MLAALCEKGKIFFVNNYNVKLNIHKTSKNKNLKVTVIIVTIIILKKPCLGAR